MINLSFIAMSRIRHLHFTIFSDGARHPTRTFSDVAVFGTLPPKPISYTEFCPPPNCPPPNCNEYRCNNAFVNLHDIIDHLEIRQFESIAYPGITNRTFGKSAFKRNL